MKQPSYSMQVYLAGPITEILDDWRASFTTEMRYKYAITCVSPLAGELYEEKYGTVAAPVLTTRDKWMATQSDVVLANFLDSTKVSIGTCIEIGWASQAGVPIVAIVPVGNVHNHAMIDELVTMKVETLEEAKNVLRALNGGL